MIRTALSYVFFAIGDAIYVVFDQWLPCGMVGPIYSAYSGAMNLSARLQPEDARGPWIMIPTRR